MKKEILFILFSGILIMTACKNQSIPGNRLKMPLAVDGEYQDWQSYASRVITTEGQSYLSSAVLSDSVLYFMFRFNDQRVARRIAMRGFHLWLDVSGKKKKLTGIHFRSLQPNNFDANIGKVPRHTQKMAEGILKSGEFYWGRAPEEISLDKMETPRVTAAVAQNKGVFCFEYAIPLSRISRKLPSNATVYNRLMLGLEIPGVSQEQRNAEVQKRKTGGSARGMGGGMRGGRGGRGGGRPMMDRQKSGMESLQIWLKIKTH